MSSLSDWKVPAIVQPKPQDYGYDLDAALMSVVGIRSIIPGDAFTAETLGTERAGNGVLIRADGLVLTIGYLITEAESLWLHLSDGRVVPGHVAAYDQATGFGLVQALAPVDPFWGGTALIGPAGDCLGIGSLQLQGATERGSTGHLNMIVPIDLLKPILDDLLTLGRANRSPQPWLGLYATEIEDRVVVMGV